jgi:hypothetical protein
MSNQQVASDNVLVVAADEAVTGETQVVVEVEQNQRPVVTSAEPTQAPPRLTPEQEEEIKLRSKYPNPNRPPCGSALVQKLLNKGVSDHLKKKKTTI